MRYVLTLFLVLLAAPAFALPPEEAVAKAKAALFGPAPETPKAPERLNWHDAWWRAVNTGKPLIAWVGVEAQCPD